MFLFGHLVWATGFMFLISWRGYWQELIESIVWAHEHTRIANLVYWKARLVGLAHFSIGYVLTYGPFVIAASLTIASRLLVGLYIHKGIAFRLPSWVS